MGIHENILAALEEVAVNADTGEAKVFIDAAPQGIAKPFVIFTNRGKKPLQTLDGPVGWTNTNYIFECWAERRSDADELAGEVRDAITASADITLKYELEISEDDSKAYVPLVDEWVSLIKFSFWHEV